MERLDEFHGMATGVFTGDECLAGRSPMRRREPDEDVPLIPYGCTNPRMAELPVLARPRQRPRRAPEPRRRTP